MNFHPKHLCSICIRRFDEHGAPENPIRPFGCPGRVWPKWPKTIKDMEKAGALYDKRIRKFWTERDTIFQPVR